MLHLDLQGVQAEYAELLAKQEYLEALLQEATVATREIRDRIVKVNDEVRACQAKVSRVLQLYPEHKRVMANYGFLYEQYLVCCL